MTIEKAMRTYRIPNPTTQEDLESRWSKATTTARESPATSARFTNTLMTTFPAKESSGLQKSARSNSKMMDTRFSGRCSSKHTDSQIKEGAAPTGCFSLHEDP